MAEQWGCQVSAQHTLEYDVTEMGQVFSTSSNWRGYGARPLIAHPNSHGYLRVRLLIDGKRKSFFVHKLVAERFLEPRPSPKHEIRHLDGNKLNNSSDNLAWGTRQDNADDREKHGRTSRGQNHSEAIKKGIYANR